MSIIESLLTKIITEILKQSAKKVWKNSIRDDKVLKILDFAGLRPDGPKADFKSVYAYTLIEYGIDKPEPILHFFRNKEIMYHLNKSG